MTRNSIQFPMSTQILGWQPSRLIQLFVYRCQHKSLVVARLWLQAGVWMARKFGKSMWKFIFYQNIYIYILVLIEESKDSIKNAVKKNDEGFPIFERVLVEVFLMVWILWSIPFSNILLVLHLIFHLEFLICWIIWDVLLCLITDGISRCFYFQSDALERLLQALLERKVYWWSASYLCS